MFLKIISNNNLVGKISFFVFFVFVICFKFLFSNSEHVNLDTITTIVSSANIYIILNFIFLFFISIGLNNMIYEKGIIKKNNTLVAIVFLTIHPFLYDFNLLLIGVFILFFLENIIEIFFNDKINNQVFYAAFLISCASLFNFYLIFYSLLPLFFIFLFKQDNIRYFIIYLLGLIVPYFFIYFLELLFEFKLFNNINSSTTFLFQLKDLKFFIPLVLISIFSFIELFNWMNKKSIRSRNSFFIIIFFAIFTILFLLLRIISFSYFVLLFSFPASLFLANYYLYSKRIFIKHFLFFIFTLTMFFSYYNF